MVKTIDAPTLNAWLADESEGPLVIDVRTVPEFELGHVPESVNVPMAELSSQLSTLDFPSRIVVVCEVGALSKQAGRLIEAYEKVGAEQEIANLAGGYREWCEKIDDHQSTS